MPNTAHKERKVYVSDAQHWAQRTKISDFWDTDAYHYAQRAQSFWDSNAQPCTQRTQIRYVVFEIAMPNNMHTHNEKVWFSNIVMPIYTAFKRKEICSFSAWSYRFFLFHVNCEFCSSLKALTFIAAERVSIKRHTVYRNITRNVAENMILHEIFCVISRFPCYISRYIVKSRFPLQRHVLSIHKL